MTGFAAALDLLPLAFFTALVVYALAMGSTDLPRSVIRVVALLTVAVCLAAWGVAALAYADWGAPAIDDFYGTAVMRRWLGAPGAGWLLLVLAVVPLGLSLWELWRRKTRQ